MTREHFDHLYEHPNCLKLLGIRRTSIPHFLSETTLWLWQVTSAARTSVSLNSNLSAILPPTTTAALYPCIHGPWCMAPFNHLLPLLVDIIFLLISQFKLSEMLVVPIRAIATILFPFIWAIISFSRFVKFFAIQWELVAL